MKKLERVINVIESENKIVNIISDWIDGTCDGDWTDYEDGKEVIYDYDLADEDYSEMLEEEEISVDGVKEFIGKGICLDYGGDDVWYNVSIENNTLIAKWVYVDIDGDEDDEE